MSASRSHFSAEEIRRLLAAADRHLAQLQRITIIGGSAAALSGADSTTTDRDFGHDGWRKIRSIEPLVLRGRRLDGETKSPALAA